jgi:hypothetical protein|tara:strand:- start:1838 stop:2227 length:390 start_codon:yes stop_codon:yes gene_type:complete
MDKSQILKGFNDHFVEFVEDIERVFPNDNDISTVKASFIQMRKANPKLVIKAFNEYFLKIYRVEIEDGNINFFINKDYNNDLSVVGDSDYILKKIDVLREPVKNMNTVDRVKVVKYIQNLSKLCDVYYK